MSRRRGWAGAAVLWLALASLGCDVKVGEDGLSVDFAGTRATDEWVRSYDIKPGGRLEIINVRADFQKAKVQIEALIGRGLYDV